MVSNVHGHLSYKIFLSYLLIILLGGVFLAISAEFIIPTAFRNHMGVMMGEEMMGPGMMGDMMREDLFSSFRRAFNEALIWAGLSAFVIAVVVSIFVSRQVVAPVREMMSASQSIAQGSYAQRVRVKGDQDELDQLALSFNQMAETLEKTETMRRQLIGDITHELRTPLAAIKGSMEGLIDGVLPQTPETYQDIYREADRLQRLVDDLQELSRVESGAFQLAPEPLNLLHLVETTLDRLRPQFIEKEVELSLDLPQDPIKIFADPDRISQILINLVGNALQYTPSGGRVDVTTRVVGGEAQISIVDTGIGIPAEHLPHIFTRFYRVDKSRARTRRGGSGIGLTIAKHLVEAHGGRIWAKSSGVGQGSEFLFTLPLK